MPKKKIKKFSGANGSWVKDYIPAQVRTFTETLAGKRDPITEKDFTEAELKDLQDACLTRRPRKPTAAKKA